MDDRSLLARLLAGPASAADLAAAAGASADDIASRLRGLRQAGIPIDEAADGGYALVPPFDLLDVDAIVAALAPQARARLASLEVAWTVDSTNAELLRREVPAQGLVAALLAECQSSGRGRRGRDWQSPLAAHLYLSAARRFATPLAKLGGLSVVAGLASAEALHALGFGMVRLKWPNDLVVADNHGMLRKLGGLLVEGGGPVAASPALVIGVGINVRMPEREAAAIGQPWCELSALAAPAVSRNTLAATLVSHWLPALETFDREGLEVFRERLQALDVLRGREVAVQAGTGMHTGTALGIGPDGALRLRSADGAEGSFHSGEVSVRLAEAHR